MPGRLKTDRAVWAGHGDDLAAFFDRLPAKFGQRHQQIANAAGLLIGRRVVIGSAIYQLFMLGADPPGLTRLLARRHRLGELGHVFDHRIVLI